MTKDLNALFKLAIKEMQENHYHEALRHFHELIHQNPENPHIHFHLGLLLLRMKQFEGAKKQFQNVLALDPMRDDARFHLASLALFLNQDDEALKLFKQCLKANPSDADIYSNLGVIALRQNKDQEAIDWFTKALLINPQHEEAKNNLAATFMHHDRFENAMVHYEELLKSHPNNIEYLYNHGVAAMSLGHLSQAKSLFTKILDINPNHFAALNNLAVIYLKNNDKDMAKSLLKRALLINPDDAATVHVYSALIGHEVEPQKTQEYARNLFNNYALYYDRHMKDALSYSLPEHIANLLFDHDIKREGQILDLGCGTGLAVSLLVDNHQEITGVDLSDKMLQQAKEKGIYQHLIQDDVYSFLKNNQKQYQLIIAADVFPYIKDLEPLFHLVKQHLVHRGAFVFSIEQSHGDTMLQSSGRYAHQMDEIKTRLKSAGLDIIEARPIKGRQQQGEPVSMVLFLCVNNQPQ